MITLSVVVPMYDEEEALPYLVPRLRAALDSLEEAYEVVAVDDGSKDGTVKALQTTAVDWPQLRIVRLLRNAGHQAALSAGLVRARGEYVVSIDADLQDPPELIADMVRVARERGLDVVYGVRGDRSSDSAAKRWTAEAFYWLMRRLAGPQVPHNAGDFRLMSRRAVDAVNGLPEYGRVLRLAVPWFGFPSTELEYTRDPRAAGDSKYPLSRMLRLAFDSVTAFSAAPLRVATWLGGLGVLVCLGLVAFLLVAGVTGTGVPGWASTLLIVTTLGAVQLLSLGLLGEYVGRLYESAQARPGYVIASDSLESSSGLRLERRPQGDGESAS